jgi:hypothetical protein
LSYTKPRLGEDLLEGPVGGHASAPGPCPKVILHTYLGVGLWASSWAVQLPRFRGGGGRRGESRYGGGPTKPGGPDPPPSQCEMRIRFGYTALRLEQDLLESPVGGHASAPDSLHEEQLLLPGQLHQLLRLLVVHAQRLLTQHVLGGVQYSISKQRGEFGQGTVLGGFSPFGAGIFYGPRSLLFTLMPG